jgi:hypothetical protein
LAVRDRMVRCQQMAENRTVRFSWRAREHERTCTKCGYAWRVPRSAVHKPISGFSSAPRGRPVSLGGIDPVVPASEPELVSSEAISEVAAATGHCPKCASPHYKQRPVRS